MSAADQPVLRVIRGDATPEEIAAVLAVVLARRGAARPADGPDQVASVWGRRFAMRAARTAGSPLEPGPHGWRTSYWNR